MNDRSDITVPRRVLHIGKYFPPHPGGMETYLRDLMNVQKRQGLEVIGLVHASKRGLFDTEESVDALDGTTYQIIRSARWFNLGFVPISPRFALVANKILTEFNPDLIHIHLPNASAIWLLFIAAAKKTPWIVHWHADIETANLGLFGKAGYFVFRGFERALLQKSQKIVATSRPYLQFSRPLSKHADKCAVIPLGLTLSRLPDATTVSGTRSPSDQPTVLFLGRLAAYKGLKDLMNAIDLLPNIDFWIAGDGRLKGWLKSEVEARGLASRVKLFGNVSEVEKWQLYAGADVFVLPSDNKSEAFGLVLLEAAHFSNAVVTTEIKGSGTSWVAKMLPKSFVARCNDPEALAASITAAVSCSSHTSEMAKDSGLPATFTLEYQLGKFTALYQEVLVSAPKG